jgi:hypothetical protein
VRVVSALPLGGFCVWCERLARNGCEPEVCGHLGSSTGEAAQANVERWTAEVLTCRAIGCTGKTQKPGDYCDSCHDYIGRMGTFGT